MFRGREQSRPELGFRLLQRLAVDVAELGFVESAPKQDGRIMIMVLAPHTTAKAKTAAPAPAAAAAAHQHRAHGDRHPPRACRPPRRTADRRLLTPSLA